MELQQVGAVVGVRVEVVVEGLAASAAVVEREYWDEDRWPLVLVDEVVVWVNQLVLVELAVWAD